MDVPRTASFTTLVGNMHRERSLGSVRSGMSKSVASSSKSSPSPPAFVSTATAAVVTASPSMISNDATMNVVQKNVQLVFVFDSDDAFKTKTLFATATVIEGSSEFTSTPDAFTAVFGVSEFNTPKYPSISVRTETLPVVSGAFEYHAMGNVYRGDVFEASMVLGLRPRVSETSTSSSSSSSTTNEEQQHPKRTKVSSHETELCAHAADYLALWRETESDDSVFTLDAHVVHDHLRNLRRYSVLRRCACSSVMEDERIHEACLILRLLDLNGILDPTDEEFDKLNDVSEQVLSLLRRSDLLEWEPQFVSPFTDAKCFAWKRTSDLWGFLESEIECTFSVAEMTGVLDELRTRRFGDQVRKTIEKWMRSSGEHGRRKCEVLDIDDDDLAMALEQSLPRWIKCFRRAHDISVRDAANRLQNVDGHAHRMIIFIGSGCIACGTPGYGDSIVTVARALGCVAKIDADVSKIFELTLFGKNAKGSIQVNSETRRTGRRKIWVHTFPMVHDDRYASTLDISGILARIPAAAQILVVNDADPTRRYARGVPIRETHLKMLVASRNGRDVGRICANMTVSGFDNIVVAYDGREHVPLTCCDVETLRRTKVTADVVVLVTSAISTNAMLWTAFCAANQTLIVCSRQINVAILAAALNG